MNNHRLMLSYAQAFDVQLARLKYLVSQDTPREEVKRQYYVCRDMALVVAEFISPPCMDHLSVLREVLYTAESLHVETGMYGNLRYQTLFPRLCDAIQKVFKINEFLEASRVS